MHFNVANPQSAMLEFEIRCKRTFKDTKLGVFNMSVAGLQLGQTLDQWVVLNEAKHHLTSPTKHKTSGELHFTVKALDFGLVQPGAAATDSNNHRQAAPEEMRSTTGLVTAVPPSQEHISLPQAICQQSVPLQTEEIVVVPVRVVPCEVKGAFMNEPPTWALPNATDCQPLGATTGAFTTASWQEQNPSMLHSVAPTFVQHKPEGLAKEVNKTEVTTHHHHNSDTLKIKEDVVKSPVGKLPHRETEVTELRLHHGGLIHPHDRVTVTQKQTVYPEGHV